jgi:hypothetical protein
LRKAIEFSSFVLLAIGTLGLLTNEFIFDWGTVAVLTFAALNIVGLAALALEHYGPF